MHLCMQLKPRDAVSIHMNLMRHIALMIFAAVLAGHAARAQSTCTCTCFDGRPQAICTNPGEVSICTPDICPPKPPVLQPLPALPKPEPACRSEVVWNPLIKGYESRSVCSAPPLVK